MVLRGEQFQRSGPVGFAFITTQSVSSNNTWLTQAYREMRPSVGKRFPSKIRFHGRVKYMMVPRGLAQDDA
ncbi:MAG: hypothetical protein CV089_19980 [Nitrospira sp. WS110]|nr:hypothetical protein [Nitrospira sp. WS110]